MSGSDHGELVRGHLSELSLDRVHLDERASDPAFFALADAHLAGCATCRAALDERVAADAAFAVTPPMVSKPASEPARALKSRARSTIIATFALAATALLVIRPGARTPGAYEEPDTIRRRGGGLELRVQVSDGKGSRAVGEGAHVRPGERVGFAVQVEHAGYLMVVGWDDSGEIYAAHPTTDAAIAIAASPAPLTLDNAVQLDAAVGTERFAAIWCPEAFVFQALSAPVEPDKGVELLRGRLAPGCILRALSLRKDAP